MHCLLSHSQSICMQQVTGLFLFTFISISVSVSYLSISVCLLAAGRLQP